MAATLEVLPETELQFNLSSSESVSKCSMILRHPGTTDEYIAFKVKTTQPRRYLVRPNQGLIGPRGQEVVQILLVEKDKNGLLDMFARLGQSALDHCKDKFLVQSCGVTPQFRDAYVAKQTPVGVNTQASYETLTSMWTTVTASSSSGGNSNSGASTAVANKKLHVRHTVIDGGKDGSNNKTASSTTPSKQLPAKHDPKLTDKALAEMNPDQLKGELQNLRRKYDELVAFSVNLTAERDILNNTLEQTKRDLNREIQKNAAAANAGNAGGASSQSSTARSGGVSSFVYIIMILGIALAAVVAGIKLEQTGQASTVIQTWPVMGPFFADTGARAVGATDDDDDASGGGEL